MALLLNACTGDEEQPKLNSGTEKDEHVWKEKTEAIDKARDVGRLIGEAAARQEKAAQKATQ